MSDQGPTGLDDVRATCRKFDAELPAYLDGEDRPQVPAHARECAYCAVLLADLEQAIFASHHLPGDEPAPRVWANIRSRLADEGVIREQVSGWRRWLPHQVFQPASASAGALACLTLFAFSLLGPGQSGLKTASGWLAPGSGPAIATASVLGTDQNLQQTIRQMEESYQALETTLDPNLKATYRQSLGTLDECIRECLTHCERQPSDALAREYLLSAYRAKAQVLASALQFDGR